jgi:hypothetical protein
LPKEEAKSCKLHRILQNEPHHTRDEKQKVMRIQRRRTERKIEEALGGDQSGFRIGKRN